MSIQSLTVKGFRRLESVESLELRPLTVVLGANGAGKTSLLDVLSLIARSAAGKLRETLVDLAGLPSVLSRGRAFALDIGVQAPGTKTAPEQEAAPLVYSLQINRHGQDYIIHQESLSQQFPTPRELLKRDTRAIVGPFKFLFDSGSQKDDFGYAEHETALSQTSKENVECENFRRQLASSELYSARDLLVGKKAPVRMPQPMRPATLPDSTGDGLISCLYYLRETDRDRFDVILDTLQAAFPSFERLDFPPVAAGLLAVAWKERDLTAPIYAHELSDGTLRFLWLTTLLGSPGLPALTLIDEPEVSLHPNMLRLLVDLLREASSRTQLIVATQSESLIRFLHPSEVLAMDLENGQTAARWGDTFDLEPWLQEYTLDQLWRMNRLGANP